MAIKGIIFNAESVKAILDGRKTATRRLIKPQPDNVKSYKMFEEVYRFYCSNLTGVWTEVRPFPYQPGDILYVREAFWTGISEYIYRADVVFDPDYNNSYIWTPSIYMPKEATRIWLRVTDVEVEHLGKISDREAIKEGFSNKKEFLDTFCKLYPQSNEKTWVWKILFKRTEKPI